MMSSEEYDKAVSALRNEQVELWHKLLNFARDLQRGPDQPGPGERLEASIQDPNMQYYFSNAHFTTEEITALMKFTGPDGQTCRTVLRSKLKDTKREICTSHTLLPIVMKFLQIPTDFSKSKSFEKRYKAFEKQWRKLEQTGTRA